MSGYQIDIVVMWVDGNDLDWQIEKHDHSGSDESVDVSVNRYRDWDNLKYVFRGIEKNMPWVRKIHFVTCGQVPAWLDTDHPKLNIVDHANYIPEEFLPTFSANPIELNLHRIKGIADRFILFNDDMFAVHNMSSKLFFDDKNGLPREQAGSITLNSARYADVMPHIVLNNNAVINSYFKPRTIGINVWMKMFSLRNGFDSFLRNVLLLPFALRSIQSLDVPHMPSAFLKSTLEQVWHEFPEVLNATSRNKFRSVNDVNQYVFKQWQILSDNFKPLNIKKISTYVSYFPQDYARLNKALNDKKCKLICINDGNVEGDFDSTRQQVNALLDVHMPDRSSFEKVEV